MLRSCSPSRRPFSLPLLVALSLFSSGCFDPKEPMLAGATEQTGSDTSDAEDADDDDDDDESPKDGSGDAQETSMASSDTGEAADPNVTSLTADTSTSMDSWNYESTQTTTGSDDSVTSSNASIGDPETESLTNAEESGTEPVEEPFVENAGGDCGVGSLPSATSNARLPDPFTTFAGQRVTTHEQWRCRRQEILRASEESLYGAKPPKPASVTGTVTSDSITVEVSEGGTTTRFAAAVTLPSGGARPYPAIIGVQSMTLDRGLLDAEGVATIVLNPADIASEAGERDDKVGAFYDLYGSDSSTGALVAWAWAVSRVIDVLENSGADTIDVRALGITGCSRFGKGALAVGAFDQRIALTIPVESGTGGVPIYRGVVEYGSDELANAYNEQYWLGDAFAEFLDDPHTLPVDSHQVIAMIAPRGLLIIDNSDFALLGARSGHIAALAGAEVYDAVGARDNISYRSDMEAGPHCAWNADLADTLRNSIRKHLTGSGNEPGVIAAHPDASGNLADWVDWETPVLQ